MLTASRGACLKPHFALPLFGAPARGAACGGGSAVYVSGPMLPRAFQGVATLLHMSWAVLLRSSIGRRRLRSSLLCQEVDVAYKQGFGGLYLPRLLLGGGVPRCTNLAM